MDFQIKDNMTLNELINECNAIFNTLDSSKSSSSTSLNIQSSMSKEKLLTIHGIFKRNEILMEELKTSTDSKFNIIVKEINSNMNEIVRMYQDFERIAVS